MSKVGLPDSNRPSRNGLTMDSWKWVERKRKIDNCGDLWRIHDKLYDLNNYLTKHPGGSHWLEILKGTDCTEAFEAHHIDIEKAQSILQKYYVRDVSNDKLNTRNVTFKPDGFYSTLRKEVKSIIKPVGSGPTNVQKFYSISSLVFWTILFTMTCQTGNIMYTVGAGILLGAMAGMGHNWFHQKPNKWQFMFDFTAMCTREWQISHAISHHLYTNSDMDFEIEAFEPLIIWMPITRRNFTQRTLVYGYYLILFSLVWLIQFYSRWVKTIFIPSNWSKLRWQHSINLIQIAFLCYNLTPLVGWLHWSLMQCLGSIYMVHISLLVIHHHPNVWHQGMPLQDGIDWGIYQLKACIDREGPMSSTLWSTAHFGRHVLHHLFPTVDHSKLPLILPAYRATCERFGLTPKTVNTTEALKGFYSVLTGTVDKVHL